MYVRFGSLSLRSRLAASLLINSRVGAYQVFGLSGMSLIRRWSVNRISICFGNKENSILSEASKVNFHENKRINYRLPFMKNVYCSGCSQDRPNRSTLVKRLKSKWMRFVKGLSSLPHLCGKSKSSQSHSQRL